jgi:predicted MFS family arabinose efflux permease
MPITKEKLLRYLLLASFIGTASEQMIMPIISIFTEKVGGSVLDAGIGYAIFSVATGIIIILTGKMKWFTDNTFLVVFLGFFICSLGDASFYLVHNLPTLYLVQATNGLAVGLLNPAWEAIYTKTMGDGEEHELWSLWGGGASISTGIAAFVGAALAKFFGFGPMFLCTAVVNIVAVYYSYLVFKARKYVPEPEG